jgi:hypothetical protein
MYTGFRWGYLKERYHLDVIVMDGKIILKWILKKYDGRAWTGLIWLRTGTSGTLL